MGKFVLLVESGADIPTKLAMHHQVKVVPMHVTFGDDTKDDMSFATEEVFEFYNKTGVLPKTSGCNPGDFEKAFDEVHQ